ncbi:MAG: HRDC domain-containing protein [Wenzhouxiangella sp.]|nr:HRDC domain-containing protein [Wenzhouxiangella sp.]
MATIPSSPARPVSQAELGAADRAVAEAGLISSADKAAAQIGHRTGDAVGLDTEFVRERTYYPQPGLVQGSDGQSVWLLDAVAMPHIEPLKQLLDDRACTKILHSVGEDMEVFRILTDTVPDPLFDTQIAAAMLGFPLQLRYEQLVADTLGAELAGGKARSNWRKRPLSRDLLTYAAQDVIWLPRLHQHLVESLERNDRLGWLKEDCARLVEAARSDESPSALVRVKGAGRLGDQALSVLASLSDWRDKTARKRDLPRSFIVRDEQLVRLAEDWNPEDANHVIDTLPDPVRRRYGQDLLQLLEHGVQGEFNRPLALIQLTPDQRDWIGKAQAVVRAMAEELGIDPALIASKKELTRIARGETPDWLNGWRGKLLANQLPAT